MKSTSGNPEIESPMASLEMKFIDEYLKEKGYSSIKKSRRGLSPSGDRDRHFEG